jgi:hypothetical protein
VTLFLAALETILAEGGAAIPRGALAAASHIYGH